MSYQDAKTYFDDNVARIGRTPKDDLMKALFNLSQGLSILTQQLLVDSLQVSRELETIRNEVR